MTDLTISAKDFSDAGLEPQLGSWISSGPNDPVTVEQITRAIGDDRLAQTAESLGREPLDLAASLAADLPVLIDTATPEGRIEAASTPKIRISAAQPTSKQIGAYAANFTVIFDAVPRA
ncbi:YidB family protein [Streptomyces sp. NBC_01276]|uniref:YidB family protein n=1 Tax=Streptomyces sp. NBC_01276 TaxID=2903808 RepID=UPI002F912790